MVFCLDTSAALRWLVPHRSSAAAASLIGPAFQRGDRFIAPPLLYAEATSVLRKMVFDSELQEYEARNALQDLLSLPIRIVTTNLIYLRAYDIATRFGKARAYDAQFLAVAEDAGATLLTADEPLFKNSRSMGVPAQLLP